MFTSSSETSLMHANIHPNKNFFIGHDIERDKSSKKKFEKMNSLLKLAFLVLLQFIDTINSVELTFELPDNSKECFYQEIGRNKSAILEFQVSENFLRKI